MHDHRDTQPWYAQFWPWLLIAIPAWGVVASLAMVLIANQSTDGVVVDDYYKQGLAINQHLARDQRAADLGLSAEVRIPGAGLLQVRLDGAAIERLPALTVRLLHPTKAGRDQRLVLRRTAGGLFEAELAPLEPAHWHVLIEPPAADWRLQDRLQWPDTGAITVRAGAR